MKLAASIVLLTATLAAFPAAGQGELSARGVIAPKVEAILSAQISGRLIRLAVERGWRVNVGDVLAEFDCVLEQARARGAKAEFDGATARLVNLQRLDRMGSVGKVEVQVAAADMERTVAALEERNAVLHRCVVIAPFSGVVVDVPAHAYESVEAGKPLVSLLDDKSLRIVTLAPSNWAAWLKPGLPLTFRVDETGETVDATVSHIDGRIDPGSQTITVFAEPRRKNAAAPPLIAGMTGSALFDVAPVAAPSVAQ